MDTLELAIVDLETTGTSAVYDRIIEVGVLRVSKGQLVERFSTLVDPERMISYHIESLTGISNRDVRGAPVFSAISDQLLTLLEGAVLVAHNARFDYSFLKKEFEREGVAFSAQCLCTARLSRMLFPEYRRHNLDSIIGRLNIVCANRHRAFDDAAVLWEFLRHVKGNVEEATLQRALATILRTPTIPPLLDESIVRDLPDAPGIYIFYGQAGEPLYVGKSVNVRDRILSHFLNDRHSVKEMALCRQVADIKVIRTAGELGALLREAALIKELSPVFNRRPVARRKLTAAVKAVDDRGYITVSTGPLEAASFDDILGVFKSKRQARDALWAAARDNELCPKKLGLEKGEGACSYTQLARCRGACTCSEPPVAYNLRALHAFEATRLQRWPYSGAVLIEEKDAARPAGEVFVIDRWCIIAWFTYDEDGIHHLHEGKGGFDYEYYRIFRSQMDAKRNSGIRGITERELDAIIARYSSG